MDNNENLLDSLKIKISLIIEKYEAEKNKSAQYLKRIEDLEVELHSKQESLNQLETKYETLRVAQTLIGGSEESKTAKLKVNSIVREIDKCISLLNR